MWHTTYRRHSATMVSLTIFHGMLPIICVCSTHGGISSRIHSAWYRTVSCVHKTHPISVTLSEWSIVRPRDIENDNLVPRRVLRHDTYSYLAVATKPNSHRILTSGHRLCFRPLPKYLKSWTSMEQVTRFGLATFAMAMRCSTNWATPAFWNALCKTLARGFQVHPQLVTLPCGWVFTLWQNT